MASVTCGRLTCSSKEPALAAPLHDAEDGAKPRISASAVAVLGHGVSTSGLGSAPSTPATPE